jgi:hypothetical protein
VPFSGGGGPLSEFGFAFPIGGDCPSVFPGLMIAFSIERERGDIVVGEIFCSERLQWRRRKK